MEQWVESLMSNLMFIFIPSIVYFMVWAKNRKQNSYTSKLVLFLFLCVSIILCLSFPYHFQDRFYFDFRQVPLAIGVLYGGPIVGGALLAILSIYRFFIGGDMTLFAILVAVCIYISLFAMTRKHGLSNRPKLISALVVSTGIIPIALKLLWFWYDLFDYQQLLNLLLFRSMEFVVICVTVYLIEFVIDHFKMQKELQEIEKMRVVSQIAASVSHEIRNPLTTVKGLLQLFRESELSDEKRKNLTEVALQELTTAINIISDYLTFAKPQIEKMTYLDLSQDLGQVVSVLTPYANMQQVTLTCVVDTTEQILGDSQQFRQCLINLVKNSIEASPNGRVDIAVVTIREHVAIRIKDTGSGMTTEQIQRLGTPYYSTKEKGTGLGTMVAFSIIKVLNGRIVVESEINKGSTFVISFPKQTALDAV
ncbi:two-component system, sporulation sensor kinase B [Paenibacillus sp. 1_12]|uniref:ATP-binding protein n=1 Tax=Paenibacillus sp. 1_12 TaxID=1566278 RepID=UPI0008E5086F|nr:sensor histidine kinase [Paenibacillus sp. 1_12]SFL81526.1 two-component system, sporulation sensor kinase B [Paenibacillus sp. 1_12]